MNKFKNSTAIRIAANGRERNTIPGLVVTTRYCNRTTEDITLINRSNMEVKLPCNKKLPHVGELQAFVTYEGSVTTLTGAIDSIRQNPSVESKRLVMALESQLTPDLHKDDIIRVTIEYVITETDIAAERGRVFWLDVDMLVEIDSMVMTRMNHPHSAVERNHQVLDAEFGGATEETMLIKFKLVDNETPIKTARRYVNIAGVVYSIEPESSMELESGFYVSTKSGGENKFTVKQLSLKEADEKYHLHLSYESAEVGGDYSEYAKLKQQELRHKATIEELERREALAKAEVENERAKVKLNAEREEESARNKRRAQEFEEELSKLKQERIREEYEFKRKTQKMEEEFIELKHKRNTEDLKTRERGGWLRSLGEIVKYGCTFLTAVVSIWQLYRKVAG